MKTYIIFLFITLDSSGPVSRTDHKFRDIRACQGVLNDYLYVKDLGYKTGTCVLIKDTTPKCSKGHSVEPTYEDNEESADLRGLTGS